MSAVTHYHPLLLKSFLAVEIKRKCYLTISSLYGSKSLGHLYVQCRDRSYQGIDNSAQRASQCSLFNETVDLTKSWFAVHHPELAISIKQENKANVGFYICSILASDFNLAKANANVTTWPNTDLTKLISQI